MATFKIGTHSIDTRQGYKGPKDIIMTVDYNGNQVQFKDQALFNWLKDEIQSNKTTAQKFLDMFRNAPNLCFNGQYGVVNTITTPTTPSYMTQAYDYCNSLQNVSDEYKFLLLLFILRCYVDFNAYPKLNGCKRIFGQVLLLLSYICNSTYHVGILQTNNPCQEIHDLGFIKGDEGRTIFDNLYKDFMKKNYTL